MSELGLLPRGQLFRTPFGTRIEWRKGQGLFVIDLATGTSRWLSARELQSQFPPAWPYWIRFAALLPQSELRFCVEPCRRGPEAEGPIGGGAAA